MPDTYQHGVYIEEVATALVPLTRVSSPVVAIGSAVKGPLNTPTLVQSYSDFVNTFGEFEDFANFTLEEVAYCFFNLFNVGPLVVINVLDRSKHVKDSTKTLTGVANPLTITAPIIADTVAITTGTNVTLVKDTDYKLSRDKEVMTITVTTTGQGKVVNDSITVAYQELSASKITNADVIGGVDDDGNETGIEAVENVYPRLGLVPGTLIAPYFSGKAEVAQALAAKARNINGVFKSLALCDIDTSTIKKYDDCYTAKTSNNLVDAYLGVCWPKVGLGDRTYFLSTQIAALMCLVDSTHGDIPFESPSNKTLRMDRACLRNGSEVYLSKAKANTLNGQGIITALNFAGAWRAWGSRTSIYPTSSDPKDAWIPCRRMMSWLGNTLATSFFYKIDSPLNLRLVQTVLDSAQVFLNGLVARGALLGGKIQFLEEENSVTDLADGKIKFHLSVCPPAPARVIEFVLEYDTTLYQSLFS